VSFVRLLLAHGARPREDGSNGSKVLAAAASGGALRDIDRPLFGGCRTETVRELLAHDPGLRIGSYREMLVFARLNGCGEVLKLLP
jgi:hypothetical protein